MGEKIIPMNDPRLIGFIELFFFAYRDFVAEADAILEPHGFGRAHHRALHFVNRRPGMKVTDLLDILQITKQSLARVLRELIDSGFLEQRGDGRDRRVRLLFLTEKGRALADDLLARQQKLIAKALEASGGRAEGIEKYFAAMIGEDHRRLVQRVTGLQLIQ